MMLSRDSPGAPIRRSSMTVMPSSLQKSTAARISPGVWERPRARSMVWSPLSTPKLIPAQPAPAIFRASFREKGTGEQYVYHLSRSARPRLEISLHTARACHRGMLNSLSHRCTASIPWRTRCSSSSATSRGGLVRTFFPLATGSAQYMQSRGHPRLVSTPAWPPSLK